MRGFPYRAHRCHCGKLAVSFDVDGNPVCAHHISYIALFHEKLTEIATLIGKEAKDAWLDQEWPGDDDTTPIMQPDGYHRAREKLSQIKKDLKHKGGSSQECPGVSILAEQVISIEESAI